MIYHLSLHEKHTDGGNGTSSEGEEIIPKVIIPHQAPVNPVPHLEGKEKMFDKMTNLAYSSHSDGSLSSRMGGSSSTKSRLLLLKTPQPTNYPLHLFSFRITSATFVDSKIAPISP